MKGVREMRCVRRCLVRGGRLGWCWGLGNFMYLENEPFFIDED